MEYRIIHEKKLQKNPAMAKVGQYYVVEMFMQKTNFSYHNETHVLDIHSNITFNSYPVPQSKLEKSPKTKWTTFLLKYWFKKINQFRIFYEKFFMCSRSNSKVN